MLIRCAQQTIQGQKIRLQHHNVPLQSISPHLPQAIITENDPQFPRHHVLDAINVHGTAETISMKTARFVFLGPSKTQISKYLDIYFTILIELIWNEQRIMEIFLNTAEMAPGIYGAEAIAQQHFGRPAIKLTRANCALIALTMKDPLNLSTKHPTRTMLKQQSDLLNKMKSARNSE